MAQVYLIKCKNCSSILNVKGQQIKIVSNPNEKGFSSDQKSQMIIESYKQEKFQFCECKINKFSCKKCQVQCGYHVTEPCNNCLSASNYHFWIYRKVLGQPTGLFWNNLSLTDDDFYSWLHDNKISDVTIQILKQQEIKNKAELKHLSDQVLSMKGIKLGEISRLRVLQNK